MIIVLLSDWRFCIQTLGVVSQDTWHGQRSCIIYMKWLVVLPLSFLKRKKEKKIKKNRTKYKQELIYWHGLLCKIDHESQNIFEIFSEILLREFLNVAFTKYLTSKFIKVTTREIYITASKRFLVMLTIWKVHWSLWFLKGKDFMFYEFQWNFWLL